MILDDRAQILPRSKRERTFQHYRRVLTLLLRALDVPEGAQDLVEDLFSIIGFETEDWAHLCDKTLAQAITCTIEPLSKEDYSTLLNRVVDRKRKQRDSLLEYQAQPGNPLIIEFEAPYIKADKKRDPKYKLPIGRVIREIVAEAPVGASEKRIRAAVIKHAGGYLDLFAGEARRGFEKREHSPESDLARAATVAKNAFDRFEKDERNGGHNAAVAAFRQAFDGKLGHIIREAFLGGGNPPVSGPENGQKQHFFPHNPNADNKPSGKFSRRSEAEETGEIACIREEKNVANFARDLDINPALDPEPIAANLPRREPVGQTVEEFIAEQNSQPRAKSSKPDEWFSLADLEGFDPKAGGHSKRERKFYCPLCTEKGSSRSLNVNTHTGEYFCHRCRTKGKIREKCDDAGPSRPARQFPAPQPQQSPQNEPERWRQWFADARPIANTSGAKYLAERGIPVEIAARAGVRFGRWWRWNEEKQKTEAFDAVIFPIRNPAGELVAAQARDIASKCKKTGGALSAGVFLSSPGALDARRLVIVEAPIDALAVEAAGLQALALGGTSLRDWLVDQIAGADILIGTDADMAGDECARKLGKEFQGRASVRRLRPEGVKDWTELAELEGLDGVRAQLSSVFDDEEAA